MAGPGDTRGVTLQGVLRAVIVVCCTMLCRLGLFTWPQIGLLTARILGFARLFFRYTGFGPGRDG